MITVDEASEIILSQVRDFGIEEVPLSQSMGRVLRESIYADRDFPPFDRVTMDGIGIRFESHQSGQKKFPVAGIAAAGAVQQELTDPGSCLEVMTGACLPLGVDTVIPYEQITIADGIAEINQELSGEKRNVHTRGSDRKKGDLIISPGIVVSAGEVGVCATVGRSSIKVSRLPKAMVLSSGDELVDIDQTPESHQIRKSNVHRLTTVLRHHQLEVDEAHLEDDLGTIRDKLKNYVDQYDIIIISGGVSMGKFDFLPQALEEVGVQKLFHRIRQRPGKPFWFGSYDNKVTVFAFPGNPVSSFMCMQRYFLPWLSACVKKNDTPLCFAQLAEDVKFEPDLTYFLQVKLDFGKDGLLLAHPKHGHGSGDLANMVDADAFIQLPADKSEFRQGESYPVYIFRDLF